MACVIDRQTDAMYRFSNDLEESRDRLRVLLRRLFDLLDAASDSMQDDSGQAALSTLRSISESLDRTAEQAGSLAARVRTSAKLLEQSDDLL